MNRESAEAGPARRPAMMRAVVATPALISIRRSKIVPAGWLAFAGPAAWRPPCASCVLALAVADGEQVIGCVVDLQGGVVQAEALAQELFELAADLVAVGRAADQHMRGQGGEAAGDE